MSTKISYLSSIYPHPRDKNIEFYEETHKYTIITDPNSKYTSVTTWVHEHFPKFNSDLIIKNMMKGKGWKEGHKYWGMTPQEIKAQWNTNKDNVANAGTDLHYDIECFMNDKRFLFKYTHKELYEIYNSDNSEDKKKEKPKEWQYFINFVKDTPQLKPFRTEWTVYDEDLKLAGSIDMIYENDDGTLSIYDWKRCKEITRINNFNKFALKECINYMPDSNFWHYCIQLNTYKAILERKYNKVIKELYLVRLHPDAEENNYELIKLPMITKEINELFDLINK
jgi:ATP-dependent exoDNAse (exonuclease V) beta subunit